MGLSKEQFNSRRRTQRVITHKEFIREWCKAYNNDGSLDDVAQALGTNLRHVYSRASWLRNIGVDLPKFRERYYISNEDISDLNNLIEDQSQ